MQKHKLPITFFILLLTNSFASGFVHPVTPTLIIDRQLPSQWYGYAMAGVSIGCFIVGPFWGKMCNYAKAKTMTVIGSFGYIAGQIIMMTAYSGIQLFLGRVTAGVLSTASSIALLNYIINVSDEKHRYSYVAIYTTASSVCNAAGYFAGGMLGSISVQSAFYGQAAVLVIVAIMAVLFMEDDTPYKLKPEHGITLNEINPLKAFADMKDYMNPVILLLFITTIITQIGWTSFDTAFNYYIKDHFGLGPAFSGTLKAVVAVSGLFANTLIGMRIVKRTDVNKAVFPTTLFIALMCAAPLLTMGSQQLLSVNYVIASAINIIWMTLTQGACAKLGDERSSNTLMGTFQSMRSLGSFAGSMVEANVYSISPKTSFTTSSVLVFAGLFTSFVYSKEYQKSKRTGQEQS